jgi:hypothetical protein
MDFQGLEDQSYIRGGGMLNLISFFLIYRNNQWNYVKT